MPVTAARSGDYHNLEKDSLRDWIMSCKSCQSGNRGKFGGEIALHFPGLKGLDKPIVWVFPKVVVCLDCGFAEFSIPETELRVLAEKESAAD
jgi:hypothetical protein